MKLYEVNTKRVICIGDLHGNFDTLYYWVKNFVLKNTAIIVCGDIGLGFHKVEYYKQTLKKLNSFCKKNNCNIFCFRGNHDDPTYFSENKLNLTNIKTIPDYSVIQTKLDGKVTHNILCVGGGLSIDRTWRKQQDGVNAIKYARYVGVSLSEAKTIVLPSYWEDEMPTFNEPALNELVEEGIKIDMVCTHTCPSFVGLKDKEGIRAWMERDEELEKDLNSEREVMDVLYNKLKEDGHPITDWVYGHFHRHMDEQIEGINFTMLDMCYNSKNTFDGIEFSN